MAFDFAVFHREFEMAFSNGIFEWDFPMALPMAFPNGIFQWDLAIFFFVAHAK